MKILLINNHTDFIDKLENFLGTINSANVNIVDLVDVNRIDANSYDLVVLSGGHDIPKALFGENIQAERALIKNIQVPLIGICYGFELIAQVYGSKLGKLATKEKGVIKIYSIKDDPIFAEKKEFNVFEAHQWFINALGKDLIPLAKSIDGIEIFKHNVKLIYGFQFHPEVFEQENDGYVLLEKAIEELTKKKHSQTV
ncbi:type 1 glutamine amidotransferase [Patescibacteria group bacterium]